VVDRCPWRTNVRLAIEPESWRNSFLGVPPRAAAEALGRGRFLDLLPCLLAPARSNWASDKPGLRDQDELAHEQAHHA